MMYDNNNNPFDPSVIFDRVQAQLCRNDFCTSAVPAQIQDTKEQVILATVTSSPDGNSFSSIDKESALFVFSQSCSVAKKLFLIKVFLLIPQNIVMTTNKSIEIRLSEDRTIVFESTIINTFTESFFGKIVTKRAEGAPAPSPGSFKWVNKYKTSNPNPATHCCLY